MISINNPGNDFINAIACVLEGTAKAIRKFGVAAHNRCPWVSYINQAGRVCSHFLKRALFTGYNFHFGSGMAIVTNLETGKRYSVSLNSLYCSCEAFKFAGFPKQPCKHIKMVAKLNGSLEQIIKGDDQGQVAQYIDINEAELPEWCFLQDEGDVLPEYKVFIRVVERSHEEEWLINRCVGRLVEGMKGIDAYGLKSNIRGTFVDTWSAVEHLVKTSGYRLADVATAYEQHLDLMF